ncbi:NAD(P)-dependent oxidoreductase [Acrocarpospora pleiomorpha]|uniref:NAD(P)-dependent oxidoreductase n=1 Tax=Acrocarpospora pleiomorpha TaxID=90975 RepID=A0A5M3XJN0_9ACTN|nr:SDR family oxidoreductase [Acrocarpospora pleiomorpha]GES18298.1 NAD(P)-dependent oxidoreductase [Acrocarpospora pleiomorpha]
MGTIVVTGSTGRLGGRVARLLAAAGVPQRLLVRDQSRAPHLPGATVATADYSDHTACRTALTGADTVLMVSAAENADRLAQHRTFVDAAAEAGIGHLVYISFYGAGPTSTFTLARDHWATEEHIKTTGLPHTFLRDNLYADFIPMMVGADGVIRGPAGTGRASVVAQDDIADVTTAVLRDPAPHTGLTHDLTGPEALTLADMCEIITEVTGAPVRYERETIEEAYASRSAYNAPSWLVDAWVSTYTAIAHGEMDGVSSAVPDITGHPATPLAEVLRRSTT